MQNHRTHFWREGKPSFCLIYLTIIQRINEKKMWGNSHTFCKNCKRACEKKPPTFQDKSSAMCQAIFSEDERPA
jgi:hypothetical protein